MQSRKTLLPAIFLPLVIGFVGLTHLMEQPRFQSFHNVDILQLIGSGMCFGVALFALLMLIRSPRVS
jgi:hypothetical protein